MIYANAVVDTEEAPKPGRLGKFRVEVWGREPHDYVRVYTIKAKSDNLAAHEGLQRFDAEITALLSEKG